MTKRIPQQGFTLIEVLVVIAMMAIIVLPMLGMFGSGLKVTHSSRQNMRAANIAQGLMDGVMSQKPDVGVETGTAEGVYSYTIKITSFGTLRKAEVEVTWPGASSPLKVVTLFAP